MDIKVLDDSIQQYGDLSWDEIREKSHDYAWRSTTLNRPMSIQNMMLETGCDDGFIQYVKEEMKLEKMLYQN